MQTLYALLWKEYTLSDSRYLTSDVFTVSVEALTVVSIPAPTGIEQNFSLQTTELSAGCLGTPLLAHGAGYIVRVPNPSYIPDHHLQRSSSQRDALLPDQLGREPDHRHLLQSSGVLVFLGVLCRVQCAVGDSAVR